MLGADVVVAELEGLSERKLQDLLRPRGEGDVAGRGLLPLTDDLLNLLANSLERNPEALQGLSGDTLTLVDQAQEDVLGADVVVVEHPGFFLSQDDNPPRAVGEPLEHRLSLLRAVGQFGVGPRPVLPHASPAGRDSSFQLPTSVRGSPPRSVGKPAVRADNCSNPMVRDDVPAGQADTRHTCTPMANGTPSKAVHLAVSPLSTRNVLPLRTNLPCRGPRSSPLRANRLPSSNVGLSPSDVYVPHSSVRMA